jgi:hypothetical protein
VLRCRCQEVSLLHYRGPLSRQCAGVTEFRMCSGNESLTNRKLHDQCQTHSYGERYTQRKTFRVKVSVAAHLVILGCVMSGVQSFQRTVKLSPLWCRALHVCTPPQQQQQQQQQQQSHNYLKTLARPDSIDASWVPFTTKNTPKPSWERLFDLDLPEGRCIGLRLSEVDPSHADALTPEGVAHAKHWIHNLLHPQEVSFGVAQPSQHARTSFFLGRLAMRDALRMEKDTAKSISILKDEHGRPTVPHGYLGSISHKGTIGVALVATTTDECLVTGIGIDIEQTFSGRRSIAPRVLTEREQSELGRIDGLTPDEEVLLRFR